MASHMTRPWYSPPTAADVLRQLDAWALSWPDGERVVGSMRASVPFVRAAARQELARELRDRVDERARRRSEPWSEADVRRVMAGMRAGEPIERIAYALRRTCSATMAQMSRIRGTYPAYMWELSVKAPTSH